MADNETATLPAPETGGDNATRGSEFARPTGEQDDAVWAKHFGKDAKEPKGKPASSKSAKPSKSDKSDSVDDKPKAAKPSDAPTKDSPKSTGASASDKSSTPKDTKSPKKDGESEATGQKTAEDPEAPSKKARDLFAEAKKTEDRREARKLYKRAMVEAFGEVPEEFDDKKYVAVRTERAAKQAALDEQSKKNETRIQEAVTRLKPAIYVMRQLEDSKLVAQLSVPFVEKAVSVMKALRELEAGDFTQLAEVIAKASGVDHDEAMKRFVRGVKISPEGRASRQAAEDAKREAAETRAQLQELQRQLQQRETTQTEAQKQAEARRNQETVRSQWLDDIESECDGHPVLQLPRGKERVLAYLIKTAHPTLKTPRFSKAQAADRVVAHEKRRLQEGRHLLDDGGEAAPPARSEPRRIAAVSRVSTGDVGVRSEDPTERFNAIFDKHASTGRRRR